MLNRVDYANLPMKFIIFLLTFMPILGNNQIKSSHVLEQQHINLLVAQIRTAPMDPILFWNQVMLHACGNDYDPSIVSAPDQDGPGATARAFGIIHGAMHDSLIVFNPVYKSIFKHRNMPVMQNTSERSAIDAAITEAAFLTLSHLYPKQQKIMTAVRNKYLMRIPSDIIKQSAINKGIYIGRLIADSILKDRVNDGSQINQSYVPSLQAGYHQADPTHPKQGFVGAHWGNVKPFLLNFTSQYRPRNIIGDTFKSRFAYLNSQIYLNEFDEIRSMGSKTSKVRTEDQTHIGIAWGYDGVPKLGTPPRLYNQIVRVIATQQNNTLEQNARLFALVNIALGDAGFAAWEAKYFYRFWRPIVAIRQSTDKTRVDSNWLPLGAQGDGADTNFTPPFPAYVSGHSTFGSACFETLRLFYKTDTISFQFQSDEYNGQTIDSNTGKPRPARIRKYSSFTQAEMENYMSRLYLGVHWRSDAENGKILGRQIAQHVYRTAT
ncbi:unnamed protein product [Rotaria socialis]|uniref:Phosphatidic acid phosphatase type 2/haloperoxidase domain-containing protein n=2 Tax=Rotaria socialis TaxID=392032 RepID=A0A820AXM3_9BILA|nr:unnamed protein product [Rotaria socialis]CAF3618941.1 unnamed protein product [Rotaria socialis]CAF3733240.1 unnamed protein product [Rotaria socialis]CAF4199679.1 unnamed protein product [Rotaria socialis]CAF4365605.1 unnamed protein product [Rotaria socialis]